jgi:hypothetical protein
LVVLLVLVAVERKPGDNNCLFLSAAAPSLQFLAFLLVGEIAGCGFKTLKGIKHTVLFQQQVAYNTHPLFLSSVSLYYPL